MKRFYKLLSILAIPSVFLLFSYSGGSPGGKTGSMGDGGNTCTDCHNDFEVQEQDGWISTNVPAVGYTPGETYKVFADGTHEGVVKFGFELTAENEAGDKMGTFTITQGERTQFTNDDAAVTHTQAGNVPIDDANVWEMDWTAPTDAEGNVIFYAAFNAANGNTNTGGDQIYTSNLSVKQMTTGLEDDLLASKVNVYPNPSSDFINISLPYGAEMRVIDMLGHEILYRNDASKVERLDVSGLKDGIYFVQILSEGAQTTKKFMKN